MMNGKFALLEYIGDVPITKRYLQTWVNLVDQRARLYDFMLHDSLVNMCGGGSFNVATLTNAGFVAVAPQFAVTYVEDHDTVRPCFDFKFGIQSNKILAYAFILTSEGYPSVFIHDYYFSPDANTNANPCVFNTDNPNDGYVGSPLKPKIDRLIASRKRFAAGSTTYLPQTFGNSQDVYVAKRGGGGPFDKPGCIFITNRARTNLTVKVNTGWAAGTNVVDYVGNFASVTTDSSSNITFTALATNYAIFVRQPQPAADIAGFAAYNGGWTNGSNGGWGFGGWTLRTSSGSSSSNGFFTGLSTGNDGGSTPGIDTGRSWGMYANHGATSVAYRVFSSSLPVGATFKLDTDNGYLDTGSSAGVVLRNGTASSSTADAATGARFMFYFIGGDSTYTIWDSSGAYNSGIPYTSTGLRLAFALTSVDGYALTVTDNATGATYTFSGTLGGTAGTTLDSVALFNNNAGTGQNFDAFFNSMEVVSP